MSKLPILLALILISFTSHAQNSDNEQTDRITKVSKEIFATVVSEFDPELITISGLVKCKKEGDLLTRLIAKVSFKSDRFKQLLSDEVASMSATKPVLICETKELCQGEMYRLLNTLELMKSAYLAASLSTMRLVNVNKAYCQSMTDAAAHLLK